MTKKNKITPPHLKEERLGGVNFVNKMILASIF